MSSNAFEWLGETLGAAIRALIDALGWVFDVLSGASAAFVNGFARTLGVDSGWFSITAVAIGLLLLYAGVRSLLRRRFFAGGIWIFLGLWLLSALVR